MIQKSHGELVVTCNECGHRGFGGTVEDFHEFLDELKAAGWRIKNNGGEWEHFCPDCAEELF